MKSVNFEEETAMLLQEYERETGRPVNPPVPVELIVELTCGFEVMYDSLPPHTSGQIDFVERVVTIEERDPEVRQRFSLAHEAGHARLHHRTLDIVTQHIPGLLDDRSEPHFSRKDSQTWFEVEANRFAAALLMPLTLLRLALEATRIRYHFGRQGYEGAVIRDLADCFAVSAEAMTYRLRNSGLVAELHTYRLPGM
jgi:Zn-dependent peptidase ImmA (M78 family)